MRWPEPDVDTFLAIAWLTAAFFFLVAVVSGIGELLGWWDPIGGIPGSAAGIPGEYGRQAVRIGMSVGATVSVLVTLAAIGASAGRRQVADVGDEVRSVGDDVRSVGDDVRSVVDDVRDVGSSVEANGEILVSVDSKLDKLDDLDRVQRELDQQTGVLEDIRDALA